MKKLFISFLVGFLLVIPLTVSAINLGGGLAKKAAVDTAGYAAATETSFAELIGSVIKTVLSFVGVIFLVLMVYAGYLWMTARGEESQIEKAQDIIRSSIIGLVVLLGAFSITTFVVPKILERTTGQTPQDAPQGEMAGCCKLCKVEGPGGCVSPLNALEMLPGEEGVCAQLCRGGEGEDPDCVSYTFTEVPVGQCF